MSWTYRVRKRIAKGVIEEFNAIEYGIVEFYNNPDGWTKDNIAPISNIELVDVDKELTEEDIDKKGIEELRWHLTEMLKALEKSIINEVEKP